MAIRFYNEGTDYRFPAKRIVTRWLREVAAAEGYRIGDINYIFCSSEYHRDINRQFLGHDYFTDVITFDESDRRESRIVGGEVYIDVDTVIETHVSIALFRLPRCGAWWFTACCICAVSATSPPRHP